MTYWRGDSLKEKRIIFYDYLKQLEDKQYLSCYFKYQLAPVIMGFKPSMTITLRKCNSRNMNQEEIENIIKGLGLKVITLRENRDADILLIYRECLIEALLEDEQIRTFLEEVGYGMQSVEQVIEYLVYRYEDCHCPHELGVFLGFNLEDVRDYMNESSKECLLCGYWRVYNNVENAKQTFKNYDLAKDKMLSSLLEELQQAG